MRAGASAAGIIRIDAIPFHPELSALCEMNSCGRYNTNWACPPGSAPARLFARLTAFTGGVVFQHAGKLEDSFDYARMMQAAQGFSAMTETIRRLLPPVSPEYFILGAGGCNICPACAYPGAPCRHPGQLVFPLEACGINVAALCALAGLRYGNGQNTVTYTGLIAFHLTRPDTVNARAF